MPVTAAIKFTQGITTDDPGRALIVAAGVAVVMTNGDNTDVFDWTWELLTKPSASAIPTGVIAAGAVVSASSTPDVPGSYLARLTVKDTAGNQAQDTRAFIVREGSGRIVPPFRGDFASLNYGGQVEGWDPAMEQWLHAADGKAPRINASTGAIDDIPSIDPLDLTAAEGLRFTNAIGPTINGIASGYGGRRLYVMATVAAIVLANENAGSVAANRIVTGTGADATLQAGSSAWLVYDGVDLRWRLQPLGASTSAGTGPTGWSGVVEIVNAGAGGLDDIPLTGGARRIRFTGAGPVVRGIDSTGIVNGEQVQIAAIGTAVSLFNQQGTSLAANRLILTVAARSVPIETIVTLQYDTNVSRWRLLAGDYTNP